MWKTTVPNILQTHQKEPYRLLSILKLQDTLSNCCSPLCQVECIVNTKYRFTYGTMLLLLTMPNATGNTSFLI